MGLLTIIRKVKSKELQCRILILGLDNSGKTTIVHRLFNPSIKSSLDIHDIEPTLGFTIKTLRHSETGVTFNLWDVGGQTTIRSYWRNYFEQTDGIIWVVDSCDSQRFPDVKRELTNIIKCEKLLGVTVLVMANKQDIDGSCSSDVVRDRIGVDSIMKSGSSSGENGRHYAVMGCSGIGGQGVKEGIMWMAKDFRKRVFMGK